MDPPDDLSGQRGRRGVRRSRRGRAGHPDRPSCADRDDRSGRPLRPHPDAGRLQARGHAVRLRRRRADRPHPRGRLGRSGCAAHAVAAGGAARPRRRCVGPGLAALRPRRAPRDAAARPSPTPRPATTGWWSPADTPTRSRSTPPTRATSPGPTPSALQGQTAHDVGLSADAATCTAPGYTRTGRSPGGLRRRPAPDGLDGRGPSRRGCRLALRRPRRPRQPHRRRRRVRDRRQRRPGGPPAGHVAGLPRRRPERRHPPGPRVRHRPEDGVAVRGRGGALRSTAARPGRPRGRRRPTRPARRPSASPCPAAAGAADARVRFHYQRGLTGWWWQVDDVFLGDATCAATPSGLVVGHTRSSLTGRPLNGVEVSADGARAGHDHQPRDAGRTSAFATASTGWSPRLAVTASPPRRRSTPTARRGRGSRRATS